MTNPLLSDLQPTRTTYCAGDRLIARVSIDLGSSKKLTLQRMIRQYTREDVRILIVNCSAIELIRIRGEEALVLAGLMHTSSQKLGVLSFGASKVDLDEKDGLVCKFRGLGSSKEKIFKEELEEWSPGIEKIYLSY